MQELHMRNSGKVGTQGAVLAGCSCHLASAKPRVLGCERSQELAIRAGSLQVGQQVVSSRETSMPHQYELEPLHRNVPDDDFLHDLRRVASELGSRTVSIRRYDERGRFSASALQRRFGSWHAALSRAGLQRVRYENQPDEVLFANLADIWERLGHQPRMVELTSQTSRLSADTYKRRFGGWRKALAAFVDWANDNTTNTPSATSQDARQLDSGRPRRQGPREPSDRLRFLVMRRDNFSCRICGATPARNPGLNLVVDHISPWDAGGRTVIDNLQTLCERCNGGQSNLPLVEGGAHSRS